MEFNLGLQHVFIGGKGVGFGDDFKALGSGPVKTDHQKMQVGGQAVRRYHFLLAGTHYCGQGRLGS